MSGISICILEMRSLGHTYVAVCSIFVILCLCMQWKSKSALYSRRQDFETGSAGMCDPSYMLLELVFGSVWRSRTNISF